jgi:hypothetical protein
LVPLNSTQLILPHFPPLQHIRTGAICATLGHARSDGHQVLGPPGQPSSLVW